MIYDRINFNFNNNIIKIFMFVPLMSCKDKNNAEHQEQTKEHEEDLYAWPIIKDSPGKRRLLRNLRC